VNFFLPSVELLVKQRSGAKVHKRYDGALTPHQRLLALKALDEATAARLDAEYLALNPAALRWRLTESEKMELELTRFCGHLSIGDPGPQEGSPHAKNTTALHAGVPL
jgi:hypothetical protein